MAKTTLRPIQLEHELDELPYPPNWVDRLADWIDQLPVPAWLAYGLAWIPLFALQMLLNWSEGVYAPGTLFPFHAVLTGAPVALGLLQRVLESVLRF